MALADAPRRTPSDDDLEAMRDMVGHIMSAVFGNPLDTEDHGMIGEMRETRRLMSDKLDKLFRGVVALCSVLVALGSLALALH